MISKEFYEYGLIDKTYPPLIWIAKVAVKIRTNPPEEGWCYLQSVSFGASCNVVKRPENMNKSPFFSHQLFHLLEEWTSLGSFLTFLECPEEFLSRVRSRRRAPKTTTRYAVMDILANDIYPRYTITLPFRRWRLEYWNPAPLRPSPLRNQYQWQSDTAVTLTL